MKISKKIRKVEKKEAKAPKVRQRSVKGGQKRGKGRQKGDEASKKGSKKRQRGAKRRPRDAKGKPKGGKRATKLHPKTGLGARVGKRAWVWAENRSKQEIDQLKVAPPELSPEIFAAIFLEKSSFSFDKMRYF